MITYELTCAGNHRFEGWFANREAFEEQMADRRIRCPVCDSVEVRKLPSAVAVHVGRSPEGGAGPERFQTRRRQTRRGRILPGAR